MLKMYRVNLQLQNKNSLFISTRNFLDSRNFAEGQLIVVASLVEARIFPLQLAITDQVNLALFDYRKEPKIEQQ